MESKKMSEGFVDNVEFELPKEDIKKLLKSYKKIKKYQKSSLFAIKSMDGTESIISKMIEEAEEEGF
jgi:hypothetical protein